MSDCVEMADHECAPGAPALVLEPPALLLADMDGAKGRFTGSRIDYHSPCTASASQSCHVVRQLTAWNDFLSAAQLELREVTGMRGQLSLTSFKEPWLALPSRAEMDQAATAVYCLLKRHHCVISFTVGEGTLKRHETLLCEALRNSMYLKTLKLHFATADTHKELCTVIASMGSLELLVCDTHRACPPQFMSALTTLLRTTTSLTSLRMPHLSMREEGARQFLEALQENRTLTEIHVQDTAMCAAPGVDQLFIDYVSNARVLTTLSVEAYFGRSRECLRLVLWGLLQNRTITRVTMAYFELDVNSAELVSRVFAENTVLRAFNVAPVVQGEAVPGLQRAYDRWLDALLQNETLEEVCLSLSAWTTQQWKRFFDKLSAKKNLRSVTIDTRYNERHLLPHLCVMLRESGADHKVFFGSYHMEDSLDLLESNGFRNFQVYPSIQEKERFLGVFDHLATFGHITTVHLGIWAGNMDTAMAAAIGRFIEKTSTLRRLFLSSQREDPHLPTVSKCWATIVNSLAGNRSLRELHVDKGRLDDGGIETLARAVASSLIMRRVHYIPRRKRDASVFVQALAESLVRNYSLLSLTVDWCMDKTMSREWFAVAEVPRRNAGLVARAAYFASGTRFDRDCAQSLEQAWRSPALLEELVESAALDKDGAMACIRRRLRTMENLDVFMRLAGVVKERVQCLPKPQGDPRPQLDDLDEYCWRRVRHYLTLQDVRADDPAPKTPPDA